MAKLMVLADSGRWEGVGIYDVAPPQVDMFSDVNPPWRPGPGETIFDNMPTGATVVNASEYTSSRDLYSIFNLIDKLSSPSGHVYIQFDAGDYYVSRLYDYGFAGSTTQAPDPAWIGYNNGNKKIQGCIGAGFSSLTGDFLTRFVVPPDMMEVTPKTPTAWAGGARTPAEGVINSTSSNNDSVTALYFSGSGATVPMFFSGISFDGTLQTPYMTYSAASQAYFKRNHAVAAPIAWNGMSLWASQPGSRFQYCRFRGFGFALNSAPPYECGCVNSNRCNLTMYALEVDGRIPAWSDPARPRASGGWMWNKELDVTGSRFWQHHTRRSGMAMNTNTKSTTEKYRLIDYQGTDIANIGADDPWPSDAGSLPGGFNAFNVEGLYGSYDVVRAYCNSEHSHFNIAFAAKDSSGVPMTIPDKQIISVKGFKSDDSEYNGCLRVSTPKNPNSSGDSSLWLKLNSDFAGYTDIFFDIRDENNVPLVPFKASLFNPATHFPSTHYCMRSF